MRILLVAPCSDGEDVGEAWVGYQWVKRLCERHDLTVLTYTKRGRTPLSRQVSGCRVVEWDELPIVGGAERLNSLLKPSYVPFYYRARRWIQDALRRGDSFDVAHQPIPVAMRYPSPLAGLGIPYIIGPVGGGLDDPPGFASDSDDQRWYMKLRSVDPWRLEHDPLLRRSFEQASCVIGIAPYVGQSLRGVRLRQFRVMSETALESLPDPVPRSPHGDPIRYLYVGRVIRTKGVREAVRAMSLIADIPAVLDVVGDGFDLGECMRIAAAIGQAERVTFHGRLPRQEIDEHYRRADVFVFPSYREPGGNVVFEAMGHGLPVIVCDRGGPGSATNADSAIRIPAISSQQLTADVAAAMRRLARDAHLRLRMGDAARRLVSTTALWDSRIEQAEALYRRTG